MVEVNDSDYGVLVDKLAAALSARGARCERLQSTDDIGGVALYDGPNRELVYDVLVVPDSQDASKGRYLFRFINKDPQHRVVEAVQSDDVDAIVEAMRRRGLV